MKKILFILLLLCAGRLSAQVDTLSPRWERIQVLWSDFNIYDDSTVQLNIKTLTYCQRLHAITTLCTTQFDGTSLTGAKVDVVISNGINIPVDISSISGGSTETTPTSISNGVWGSEDGIVVTAVLHTHGETATYLEQGVLFVWLSISTLPECPEYP